MLNNPGVRFPLSCFQITIIRQKSTQTPRTATPGSSHILEVALGATIGPGIFIPSLNQRLTANVVTRPILRPETQTPCPTKKHQTEACSATSFQLFNMFFQEFYTDPIPSSKLQRGNDQKIHGGFSRSMWFCFKIG